MLCCVQCLHSCFGVSASDMSSHPRRADLPQRQNLTQVSLVSPKQKKRLTWWRSSAAPPAPPLGPHWRIYPPASRGTKRRNGLFSATILRSSCNITTLRPAPPRRPHPLRPRPTSAQEGATALRVSTTLLAAPPHRRPRRGTNTTTRPGTQRRRRTRRSGDGLTTWWRGSGATSLRTASCACATTCRSCRTMTRPPRSWSWRRPETVSTTWRTRATDCNPRETNWETNRKS